MPIYTAVSELGVMAAFNEAAKTLADAAWAVGRTHAVGAVPKNPATPYLVVSVSSGAADNYRGCGEHGSKSYRVVVQAVGKSIGEVSFAADRAEQAYLDQRLYVDGYDATPMRSEVASPIIRDPDGGVLLSVTLTYTFHAYPTA